jgi:hypothetical protein
MSLLSAEAKRNGKRWLFWIGAGASRWCGYPGWEDFANTLHSEFKRTVAGYEAARALRYLNSYDFPAVFQLCHNASAQTYRTRLTEAFRLRNPTEVYNRFIKSISALNTVQIVTTNIDELLERNVPTADAISRNDIERAMQMLAHKSSFVCKLHGSVSDIETTVFTTAQYEELIRSSAWIENLSRLIAGASVLFVGYGLRDQYVLDVIAKNRTLKSLFGDGPHFAILSSTPQNLPGSIRIIQYDATPQLDHRTAIDVIDELRCAMPSTMVTAEPISVGSYPEPLRSAHLLFDVLTPGTWESSQTAEAASKDGQKIELTIGPGFTNAELPFMQATAMHDLLVALLCFDTVVVPIRHVGKIHDLLGSERFWKLFEESVFEFVNWSHEPAVIFADKAAPSSASLGSMQVWSPDMTVKSTADVIKAQIVPAQGKEAIAKNLLGNLEARTRLITDTEEASIPAIVRSLLVRPSVRKVLGMSGGTPITSIPRWQVFPVLRLAQVARISAACRLLKIPSAKLDFGTSTLAGPIFASEPGKEWADQVAGFVLRGSFSANLGETVFRDPNLLDSVLAFRQTANGEALRKNILSSLQANGGADVPVAVNSALQSSLPMDVLQKARDEFIRLSASPVTAAASSTLLWTDKRAEDAIKAWRARSKGILDDWCARLKVGPYSDCPCGSGEKLKFCCAAALNAQIW